MVHVVCLPYRLVNNKRGLQYCNLAGESITKSRTNITIIKWRMLCYVRTTHGKMWSLRCFHLNNHKDRLTSDLFGRWPHLSFTTNIINADLLIIQVSAVIHTACRIIVVENNIVPHTGYRQTDRAITYTSSNLPAPSDKGFA